MDIHEYCWLTMVNYGCPWLIMVNHGEPWFSMVDHGFLWLSMLNHEKCPLCTPPSPRPSWARSFLGKSTFRYKNAVLPCARACCRWYFLSSLAFLAKNEISLVSLKPSISFSESRFCLLFGVKN